jgi:hypothetical protein
MISPDFYIPPETINNVGFFFEKKKKILIENVDHIDTKIKDIRRISIDNYSSMRQWNINPSETIFEIKIQWNQTLS